MTNKITWKKGLFKCTYEILREGLRIGKLKASEFSNSAKAEINGRQVRFQMINGWFHQRTTIFDAKTNEKIGSIAYNPWYPKAFIRTKSNAYTWKYSGIWETKWKIKHQDETIVSSKGWNTKGSMFTDASEDLLVLAGLYVSDYYQRLSAIYAAAVLPMLLFPWL